MAAIPKKVVERISRAVPKFQKVLRVAKDRDVNEADTVAIITDILSEVFGYDKYLEVTSEFAIRGTYCDLAIKIGDKIQFIIEVKAIGIELKENHLRQAVDYGANQGVQWVVLTNGVSWEIYRIRFEKPINYDRVCSFNFLDIIPKSAEVQEKLFLLCKKGLSGAVRDDYYERMLSVNRFTIGAIILQEAGVGLIKRELKKLSKGLKIDDAEIEKILKNEILKREVMEGEPAAKAKSRVKRLYKKTMPKKESKPTTSEQPAVIIKTEEEKEKANPSV